MTIIKGEGSLFDSGAQALVNATNCVGVMGGGIALAFKNKFPKMFDVYQYKCDRALLHPGDVDVWIENIDPVLAVLNFPTKDHYKDPSELRYIYSGLEDLINKVQDYHFKSVAIPALGCGLGGLDWVDVKKALSILEFELPYVQWIIYEPQ